MVNRLSPELQPKQDFLNGYYTTKRKYKKSPPEKRALIEKCIDELDDEDSKELLRRKYIERQKMQAIADFMYISRATAWRIHTEALRALKIPEDERIGGE